MVKYVEPTLGPPGTKKIIVASHERSGTHFLMNTIADNFGYVSEPWFDIDDDRVVNPYAHENIQNFLSGVEGQPVLNLFKTHFEAGFFNGIWLWLLNEFHIVYIYRNSIDTLKSLRRHIMDLPWKAGPIEDEELFPYSEPCGALLRYQLNQYPTLFYRHTEHVEGWRRLEKERNFPIHYIEYEQLNEDFNNTVAMLGHKLELLPLRWPPIRPSRDERTITPERIQEASNGQSA